MQTTRRFPHRAVLLASGVMVALLAFGCKGGGNPLDKAMKEITNDQLAIMVLPQADLGQDAADLPVDPSSGAGFIDSVQWAEESPDPDDTAADVEAAGFVHAYELSYANYGRDEGVVEADSLVALYRSDAEASAFLAQFLADLQSTAGQDEGGYYHQNVTVSDEGGVGDEASLLTADFVITGPPDTTGHTAGVGFRLGRLVGFVSENRFDDTDIAPTVAKLLGLELRGVEGRPVF